MIFKEWKNEENTNSWVRLSKLSKTLAQTEEAAKEIDIEYKTTKHNKMRKLLRFPLYSDIFIPVKAANAKQKRLKIANCYIMAKKSKTKYSKEWLTKAETNQILNDPGISRRDELIVSMLYWCALRVSEMAAIKIKDINIKTGNLTLWQSKKSDTPELVHIPEQLIKSISQWTRENKLKPKDYLIRSQKGGSLSRIQIYRSIKEFSGLVCQDQF